MIDYIVENQWQMWTLFAVACLILELTSGDFFILCFSIGAAATAIASATGCSFLVCLAVFAVVSVLCLFFLRPTLLKKMHKESKVSNADAIIGRTGTVSEDIPEGGYGRVALDGDDWKALSADATAIEKGTKVKIISRDSIIIKVERA
ncbi:MAG: NfeD family protein [Bacteroidaceae bacterium]|nr:NfeD family protein [Bacteroidaceae bacterium]